MWNLLGRKRDRGGLSRLHQFPQGFYTQIAIAEDFVQQPGPYSLSRVHGHHGSPAIFVTNKMMATPDANHQETVVRQGGDQFSPCDPRTPAHAAIVMR
jgi:hypothetical protein